MRIKGFITGIAFVLLMLSVVIVGFADAPKITYSPTSPVNDFVGAQRSFNFTSNQSVNATWELNGNVVQTNTSVFSSNYTNTSAVLGYWNLSVTIRNENINTVNTWLWNVTNPPPVIYRDPATNPTTSQGSMQFFNASSNQKAYFQWFIDDVLVQDNGTKPASTWVYYMNNTAGVGSYNVKLVINNSNGTNSTTWVWNVITPSGPPPVTGLTLTRGATWINWTWVNPEEGDFNHTIVKINDTFQANTSNNYFNYTQFDPGTLNTISLQTVDASDNVNSTVVSNSSYTLNTPSGSNVFVSLNNLNVTFSQVNGEGNTSATIYSEKQPGWGDHSFLKIGNYYDITTDVTSSGNITIELGYNPLAGVNESNVKLYHWNDTSWEDVTTYLDDSNKKIRGNVSSLSPFVVGVPPGPIITRVSPDTNSTETTGNNAATFKIKVDQSATVIWKIDSIPVNTTTSIPGKDISYSNSSTPSGNHTVNVTASNANGTVSLEWIWTVRPKTYTTGNRIWDGGRPDEYSLTYTWDPMSFYAFYYDLNSNVGSESLEIKLGGRENRYIQEGNLTYSTTPLNVRFKHNTWGNYRVIGFMAEKYFAEYTSESTGITDTSISTINNKQLHKVLIDDNTQRVIYAGSTLTLNEGYVIKIKDVDMGAGSASVWLSLLKDGGEIFSDVKGEKETFVYAPSKVGSVSDLPIIALHIDKIFRGTEANAAFIKGTFQISESYTSVNNGNRYGIMEITGASNTGISMENKNSLSLSPGSINDVMGDIKIIVADNSSVLRFAPAVKKLGIYEVRGTISQDSDEEFEWNPLNFEGFYYDLNEDVGSENLSLTRSSRTISGNNLVYTTTPQPVSFKSKKFGSYNVIGFMAEKYFARYTSGTSSDITDTPISTISSKQLHKVLIDDNTQRTIYAGSTLTLNDGYVIKIKDVNMGAGPASVWLSLLKDGDEIFDDVKDEGETFIYAPSKVGSVNDLPIIALHIDKIFRGTEATAAFIRGIFQISESYTSVNYGDRFGVMEVSEVSDTKIEMKNPSSVTLSSAGTVDVMGDIKFKVADSGSVRFYPFITVSGSTIAANQLVIDAPANPMERDTITITVTASGASVDGAEVSFDGSSIGTTNSTGGLDYTLTRSGTHNITATKLGYEKAVRTIQVSEYVDTRLSIEVPAIIDQGIPVQIKVLSNGTAIPGANVTFDGEMIGITDTSGILDYTFNVSGTHNLGASKEKYISVIREISIRMPFSEYKALDINVTPDMVFTNQEIVIRSNITNSGTKADTLPVDLIINNTVVDTMSVTLAPGDIKEINFTRKAKRLISSEEDTLPGNYTIEILGQKGLVEVKEEPTNYLLIGIIATGLGAIMIYLMTAKDKISLETIRSNMNMETIRRKLNLDAVKELLVRSGKKGA